MDKVQTKHFDNADRFRGSAQNTHYKPILNYMKGRSGKILEIGCSDGKLLDFFKSKDFDVVGTDISKNNINIVKEKGNKSLSCRC